MYLKDNSFKVKNKKYIYKFKLYNDDLDLKYLRHIQELNKRKTKNVSKIKKENIRLS